MRDDLGREKTVTAMERSTGNLDRPLIANFVSLH
jgi:hypothetical protein